MHTHGLWEAVSGARAGNVSVQGRRRMKAGPDTARVISANRTMRPHLLTLCVHTCPYHWCPSISGMARMTASANNAENLCTTFIFLIAGSSPARYSWILRTHLSEQAVKSALIAMQACSWAWDRLKDRLERKTAAGL